MTRKNGEIVLSSLSSKKDASLFNKYDLENKTIL